MKVEKFGVITERKYIQFNGRRDFKNTVAQLGQNNHYSLTEPNQRKIINAIGELGKVKGNKNIQFLMDTAAKNKYSTGIILKDSPKNNWKALLLTAIASAIAITPFVTKEIKKRLAELSKPQELQPIEQDILTLREQLLELADVEQIKNESKKPMTNFERNLDYFIISSETSLEDKKYVLERLNHFMSDNYEINPQLIDRKSIVLAEMINDMAISVPDSEIPNIKAVNQKQHGMCAAISIVRKKLAYEDKPKYVDSILSELDSTPYIIAYDRSVLGTGKKVELPKINVDFSTAIENGYRIIDASTMHWMQIAHMSGSSFIAFNEYYPFDKENFDVKTDSFLNVKIEDPELQKEQEYYQALLFAKSVLERFKTAKIKKDLITQNNLSQKNINIEVLSKIQSKIAETLSELAGNLNKKEINTLKNELIELEQKHSNKINPEDKFSYIPNEEDLIKKEKIKNFLLHKTKVDVIENKTIDSIFDLVEFYNQTALSTNTSGNRSSIISHAKSIYEIAAAFRYQVVLGLENENTLNYIMREEGLKNKETLLIEHIDNLINKLENNSPHTDLIIAQVNQAIDGSIPTKEGIISSLKELKINLNRLLNDGMDMIYNELTFENKHQGLVIYIENIISDIQNGNNKLMHTVADTFDFKKTTSGVIKALNNIKKDLINNPDSYNIIFDKLKNVSQLDFLSVLYDNAISTATSDNNIEFIEKFLTVNNIEINENANDFVSALESIKTEINKIKNCFELCTKHLKIRDKNGDVLFSPDPKDIIIKKFENQGKIASAARLRELQNHFTKIAKVRSTDEFQSRQGKLRDKSLYKFSTQEKETIKNTERGINQMYQYVDKQINLLENELKDEIEDLKRIIGVNTGHYWISDLGSGLYTNEQVRILEFMTGRPHYVTENLEKGIEDIKNSPYSGLTSSSVYHDKNGWHAQYISDIAPIKLKNGEIKDVLFQDNTWGPSENENTWIDSNGLKRTDYSDYRGGSLGYITDEKYRNGNFVDRILNDMILTIKPEHVESKKYNKIKHPDFSEHSTKQYSNIILDGKSSKSKAVSDQIHDTLFIPSTNNVEWLTSCAKKLSYEEVKNKINNLEHIGNIWKNKYEQIKKRIFPIFDKGITTKEEYNRLNNDDYLKVLMEKIALKNNGIYGGLEQEIAKAKTLDDIEAIKKKQNLKALNSFKYSFNKSFNIFDYMTSLLDEEAYEGIDIILDKYNIKLTDTDFDIITDKLTFNTKDFDGSLKNSINYFTKLFCTNVNKVVKEKNVQSEIKDYIKDYLSSKLYFNKADLNLYEPENQKLEHIIKFIDRVFDPADDEDFIKTYRKIQDMTTQEFKQNVLSHVTRADLGLKNITGWEVFQKIKNYDSKMNKDLLNNVWYDSFVAELNPKQSDIYYKYEKLIRSVRYKLSNDFDDIYQNLKSDLALLGMEKLFNKYKDKNRNEYNAYPAYPKIEHMTPDFINKTFISIIEKLEYGVDLSNNINNQLTNYSLSGDLEILARRYKNIKDISGNDLKILKDILNKLIIINENDEGLADIIRASKDALSVKDGASFEEYLPYINIITTQFNQFKSTTPINVLLKVIDKYIIENQAQKQALTDIFIQKRYQAGFKNLLNNYEEILKQGKKAEIEKARAKLEEAYLKYNLMNNPKELLDTYILSIPKDSPTHKNKEIYASLLKRGLQYSTLLEIQEILMDAIADGIVLDAKSNFSKHHLEFPTGSYSMDSDEIISYMTNYLIIDDHFDTAAMFLEKLGLAEKYVKYSAQKFDYEKIKDIMLESNELINKFVNFKQEIEPLINITKESLENDNTDLTILDVLEKQVTELASDFDIESAGIEGLINTVNYIKENHKKNPKANNLILFTSLINDGIEVLNNYIKDKISEKDSYLEAQATIQNLIQNIPLDKDSEANKIREIMNEKIKELVEFREELNKKLNINNDVYNDEN